MKPIFDRPKNLTECFYFDKSDINQPRKGLRKFWDLFFLSSFSMPVIMRISQYFYRKGWAGRILGSFFRRLNEILDHENTVGHSRLTTGLYAVMWALKNYEDIYIHGFDFFINSKSHYYDSKLMNFVNENILNKGHKHDNQKEYDFINDLIDKNKIKRLVKTND